LDLEEFTGSELMMNDDTGIEENVEIEDEEELYVHALAVICKFPEEISIKMALLMKVTEGIDHTQWPV
jgi:hypothetical protein